MSVAALVRALELCPGCDCRSRFRIFTDSRAAMFRLQSGQPGPGQEMARRGIQVAKAGIPDRGAQVQILWVPGHTGVLGNELADERAVDAARRERKRGEMVRHGKRTERVSLASLKAERKKEAVKEWRG